MIDIIVPMEGEGTQAIVARWLKAVGDTVTEHEPLVELETDKVAMEVPAPASGVLREILLGADAEAAPGALLGRMAVGGETDTPNPAHVERSRNTRSSEGEKRGLDFARQGLST